MVEETEKEIVEQEESKKEIIKDIEESGVSEKIAEAEEALDEDQQRPKARRTQSLRLKNQKEEPKDLAKVAEAESTNPKIEKTLEEKKKELLARVAKLKGKLSDAPKTEELKEKVKIKKRTDMLIPLEEYVKAGIYLGTRVVTPNMKPFVYRRRADGLAIFNTDLIDEKLKEGIEYLSGFEAKDVILVCKRQAGGKVAEMFGKITGIKVFAKKYPAGVLTNTSLPDFFENELTIITDSWLDKNALADTLNVNKKVLMICDTNNFSKGADKVIIGNNKSAKSLGVIFYLLAKGYCKARGIDANIPDLEVWTSEEEEEKVRKSINVLAKGAKYGV